MSSEQNIIWGRKVWCYMCPAFLSSDFVVLWSVFKNCCFFCVVAPLNPPNQNEQWYCYALVLVIVIHNSGVSFDAYHSVNNIYVQNVFYGFWRTDCLSNSVLLWAVALGNPVSEENVKPRNVWWAFVRLESDQTLFDESASSNVTTIIIQWWQRM